MKILLIGQDFDFSSGDGISRASYEIYQRLKQNNEVDILAQFPKESKTSKTTTIQKILFRTKEVLNAYFHIFSESNMKEYDVVVFMHPCVFYVNLNSNSRKVLLWHDNLTFDRVKESSIFSLVGIRWRMDKRLLISSLKRADAVICVSSAAREMLDKVYNEVGALYDGEQDAQEVYTVNVGIDDKFVREKPYTGKRKDFVYIGAIHFSHKNIDGLIRAFSQIAEHKEEQKLHIFTPTENAEEILQEYLNRYSNLQGKVVLHKKATDEEMIRITKRAIAGLQLTKKEGFGVPILEIQALGTPVVVLKDAEILKEVTKYAIKINNEEDIAPILNIKGISEEAIEYAKSFTWDNFMDKFQRILKGKLNDAARREENE